MDNVIIVGEAEVIIPDRCGVIRTESLTAISSEEAVLIIGEGAHLPDSMQVLAAVVNSDSGFDPRMLKGTAVITCGLGSRNTISVTSRTSERMTLSLNRSIHTLHGLCEPLEQPLPVRQDMDDFGHMASFAASLLLGRFGES